MNLLYKALTLMACAGTLLACSSPTSGTPPTGGSASSTTTTTPTPSATPSLTWTSELASDHPVNGIAVSGTMVYAATDNDVAVSPDGGTSWNKYTSTNGLDAGTPGSICASGNTAYVTMYGTNSLYMTVNAGVTWVVCPSGLKNAMISGTTVYAQSANGLAYSTLGSPTWNYYTTTSSGLASNTVSNFAVSGNTICAVTPVGLCISTDDGTTWSTHNASNGIPTLSPMGTYQGVVQVSGTTITYVDTNSQTEPGIFISSNGGQNWTQYTTTNGLGNNVIEYNGVFVAGSSVYVSTGNGLSVTTNAGISWTNYANPIPTGTSYNPAIVGSTLVVTCNSNAGAAGIYQSTNGGTTWAGVPGFSGAVSFGTIQVATTASKIYIATNGVPGLIIGQ